MLWPLVNIWPSYGESKVVFGRYFGKPRFFNSQSRCWRNRERKRDVSLTSVFLVQCYTRYYALRSIWVITYRCTVIVGNRKVTFATWRRLWQVFTRCVQLPSSTSHLQYCAASGYDSFNFMCKKLRKGCPSEYRRKPGGVLRRRYSLSLKTSGGCTKFLPLVRVNILRSHVFWHKNTFVLCMHCFARCTRYFV